MNPHPRYRPSRVLAAALAALMAFTPLAQAQAQVHTSAPVRLPALGDADTESLSVGDERRLGAQIMREARRDPDFLDDPLLQAYVESLWQPLVKAAQLRGDIDAEVQSQLAWEVFLVRDRSINAFAWPGGYVGVHLALIAMAGNRDQLASVLAHELTHVTQRHIARGIGASQRNSLLTVAGILLGILAASRANNADAANAAIMGGQAAGAQGQLNFSREMEREADRIGFNVLTQAGFAPGGMAQMFERMDASRGPADIGQNFPYLHSHPLTIERIAEARNRVLLSGAVAPRPTLEHAMMQVRSRVLMDTNPQALQRLTSGESSSPLAIDRAAALYGGACARLAMNDVRPAEALLLQARTLAAASPTPEPRALDVMTLTLAQVRLAANDAPGAQAALKDLSGAAVEARPTMLMKAQVALALQRRDPAAAASLAEVREAAENLQTWVSVHPQDAGAWLMLSQTAEAAGLRLRALRAGAEARVVLGDYTGAIDRLRTAQALSRNPGAQDFIEASVIDARLRQIVGERRQLVLDARGGRSGGGGGSGGGDGGPDRGPDRGDGSPR